MLFTRRSLLTVLLPILLAGSANAQPDPEDIAKAATPSDPFALVTKEQWRADLQFLRANCPSDTPTRFITHRESASMPRWQTLTGVSTA